MEQEVTTVAPVSEGITITPVVNSTVQELPPRVDVDWIDKPAKTEEKAEAKPEEKPAEKKEGEQPDDKKTTQRLAYIAKRDNELTVRESKIKEVENKYKDYPANETEFKSKPKAFLSKIGWTLEDLIKASLDEDEASGVEAKSTVPTNVSSLEARVKAMEEEKRQGIENEKNQKIAAEYKVWSDGIKEKISQEGNHELVVLCNSGDLVVEVIERYWQANKQPLDYKIAADEVEKELENQYKIMSAAKKFGQATKPAQTTPQKPEVTPITRAEARTSSTTLTNSMNSTGKINLDELPIHEAARIIAQRMP